MNIKNYLVIALALFCVWTEDAQAAPDTKANTFKVQIWGLSTNDSTLRLGKVLQTAPSASALEFSLTLPDVAQGMVVSEKLSNTNSIKSVLDSLGHAELLTQGGGGVEDGEALPIAAMTRRALPWNVSTHKVQIAPQFLDTGYSFLAVPHTLEKGKVALHCKISFSNLDGISEYSLNGIKVSIPNVSLQDIAQSVQLGEGQSFLLVGFQHKSEKDKNNYARRVLIVIVTFEKDTNS